MNQNEPRVIWEENGWAANDGWESAHCANPATGEYSGLSEVFISIGTGLPAGSYLDAPPQREPGKAIVRTDEGWAMQADHRGQLAYHKQSKLQSLITELGDLPTDLTLQEPQSPFDIWDEQTGTWVKNAAAEQQSMTAQAQQHKTAQLAAASGMIATLQDAVDLAMATPAEEASLLDWKRYRVMLTRIDVSAHPITWPISPATA
ncbi:tail fiber assembly protein [Aeromonas sp.]|uniref:tail fiber assembly protein n=1 Tax=Aeromonas sp. TaxID=647 RepID=UPI00259093F1|nr:tail fiber assembly protein [Aeromonas sp.]MCX7133097.1 tail fiber assembly protein [Aeromonas sp.]